MPDRRPDPVIEVFGLDEDVWTGQRRSDAGARASAGAEDTHPSDEIKQGGARESRPGFSRGRSAAEPTRIPLLPGRSVTLSQLAGTVAALVVAAFLAGLAVGRGTGPGPRSPTQTPADTVAFTPGRAPNSILPTEPSFTFGTPAPNPLPSGSAGPRGAVAGPDVYALQLAARPLTQSGQNLESRDPGAAKGPWSLIVRRSDGSLGRHSAVVTYPVVTSSADPQSKARTRVGSTTGYVDFLGGIVWAINGKFARIRGGLDRTTLAAVAAQVSVRHGRPVMDHPPSRFRVVAAEPYRARVVTESRYASERLNSGPIDGLVYADVLRGASFEEALYVEGFGPGGNIGGHPAVLSSVGGGNATLAWEPTPGSIAFVGYSGSLNMQAAGATLVDLARGGRLLDHAQWTATHPSVVRNTNSYF